MIRRLTLGELIEAAKNLQSAEQIALVTAISEQLATSGYHEPVMPGPVRQSHEDNWTALAVESLARAYCTSESEYSEKDLVP
jgi:hypothetical protein